MRGIGSNRALVLVDGVPINDAFGGWVNWSKIPLTFVDRIEIIKGGGSSLWGTYAMGGVINIITKVPEARAFEFEAGGGTQGTYRLNLYGSEVAKNVALSLNVNAFDTAGFKVVPENQRGPIDQNASSGNQTVSLKADVRLVPGLTVAATINGFSQHMNVGTPLTNNARDTVDGSVIVRQQLEDQSELKLSLFSEIQQFRNTNSRVAPGRASETVALRQQIPTVDIGGSLQWSRQVGGVWDFVTAGVDVRRISFENHEKIYGTTAANAGQFLARRDTDGKQLAVGLFGEVIAKPVKDWQVLGGLRLDYWTSYDATMIQGGLPIVNFRDQDQTAVDPKIATSYQLTPDLLLRGAVYRAVRFPTLNELYRGFFSGNIAFNGNAGLKRETLVGGEIGADLSLFDKRVTLSLTPFYNDTDDLILFVTQSPTVSQRQNAGEAVSQGVEMGSTARIIRDLDFQLNYVFTDSRIVSSRLSLLNGKRVPNVPEHQVSAALTYAHPWIGRVTLRGRYVSNQYSDDLNAFPLDAYVAFDVSASRPIVKGVEAFVVVENITNEKYLASRSGALGTLGAPFQFFGGLRLSAF
jgi:outer membrane receptor protein involved in Fe transport